MNKKTDRKNQRWIYLLSGLAICLLFVLVSGIFVRSQGEVETGQDIDDYSDEYSQIMVTGQNYFLTDVQEESIPESTAPIEPDNSMFPETNENIIKPEEELNQEPDQEKEEEQEQEKENEQTGTPESTEPAEQEPGSHASDSNNNPADQNQSSGGFMSNEETTDEPTPNPEIVDDEQETITKDPRIETSLVNGESINGSDITFTLRGKDYHDSIIDPYYYQVSINGVRVYSMGVDSDGFATYRNMEPLSEGNSEILIYIEDEEGNSASAKYALNSVSAVNELQDEYVSLTLDARILGLGTLLSVNEQIYEDESASHFIERVLNDYGFITSSNNNSYGYYLARISRAGIVGDSGNVQIPDTLKEYIGEIDYGLMDPDSLGERDFNSYSGWVYLYNYSYMGVGLSNITLSDGDEIILCYTLANGAEYDGTWFYYGDW